MRRTKVVIAIVSVIILAAIVMWLSNGQKPGAEGTPDTDSANPPAASDVPNNEPQGDEEQEPQTPDETEEAGSKTVEEKLNEILLASLEFFNETNENTVITQQSGLLYNAAADIIVTPSYLVLREYMPAEYELSEASVLYVSSSDMSSVAAGFTEDEKTYTIYVSAPFEDGYLIMSKSEGQTKITKEQYNTLLERYNKDYGQVRRLTASSSEYGEINRILKANQQRSSDFYIRYGMRNDKYAVVIASPMDSYNSVKMYALAFENNRWSIKVPNLESVPKAKGVVVNVCQDFDLKLMPVYDLNSDLPYLSDDSEGITDTLVADAYMEEGEAEIEYFSKNYNYLFAKYTNGRLFLGVKGNDDVWVLGEVESAEKAWLRFQQEDERAADYVIIWE